jgi:hypothetical protein
VKRNLHGGHENIEQSLHIIMIGVLSTHVLRKMLGPSGKYILLAMYVCNVD